MLVPFILYYGHVREDSMASKSSVTEIKRQNRAIIFKYILENGSVSRQNISQHVGYSLPTVFANVTELLEAGYLCEVGTFDSTGGRKAKMVAVARGVKYAIGVDVTRRHVRFVMLDMSGDLLADSIERLAYADNYGYYSKVGSMLEEFLDKSGADRSKLVGVGISIPGILNAEKTVIAKSHVLGVDGLSLSNFYDHIKYPTYFDNDANCAAFAEVDKDSKCTVYFSLSNTVGGAIYYDGELCTGNLSKSGEIGHMIIHPGGRRCYCGKRGCLDAYCSALSLMSDPDGHLEDFFEDLERGEKSAVAKWDAYLDDLAIAVTNIRMIFDCDIILGGYVGGYVEKYMNQFAKKTKKYNNFDVDTSYITTGSYKRLSSAIGAAQIAIDDFIDNMLPG